MRKVFVYKEDNLYKIIDKATGKLLQSIDDVLLFNAKYMRYKGTKGWHGILSEEMNLDLIKIIPTIVGELNFILNKYYPRIPGMMIQIKTVGFLWLKKDKILYKSGWKDGKISESEVRKYCEPYKEKERLRGTTFDAIFVDDLFDFDALDRQIQDLEDEAL